MMARLRPSRTRRRMSRLCQCRGAASGCAAGGPGLPARLGRQARACGPQARALLTNLKFSISESLPLNFEMCLFGIQEPRNDSF